MDAEMMELVSTAATTIVGALATDAWDQTRTLVGRLWNRHGSPGQTAFVEDELGETRQLLLRDPADRDSESDLTALWRLRFRQLLAEDPAAARALEELVAELRKHDAVDAGPARRIDMRVEASGHAQVFQAGGDITNTRLP
ncbi:hypothetical protein ACFYXS_37990 [Streptomyces sp. NPDC002574]|uniref:hypothetical protein n=1 Tax=Streptomyces sp. NPDC002574 TaxID=3364652 RepID=UPI0036C92A58